MKLLNYQMLTPRRNLATIITFVCCFTSCMSRSLKQTKRSSLNNPQILDIICGKNCHDEVRLYCGSNGRTYDSFCKTRQASCHDPTLEFTEGKCPESNPCKSSREHELAKNSSYAYVSVCNHDGSYAPLQCSMGTCWCVTPLGKMTRQGSSSKIPRCGKSRHTNRCQNEIDRKPFAYKVRGLIEMDYRLHMTATPTTLTSTTEAIRWKIPAYARGKPLYYRQFKSLFRSYRSSLSKTCTKVFPKYCDANKDRTVSELELLVCMGVAMDTPTNPPGDNNRLPTTTLMREFDFTTPRKTNDYSNIQPTIRERISCRDSQREIQQVGDPQIHVPECEGTNGEYWAQVQCHMMYCFCVDRNDGRPITNTATFNGTPNCNISTPRPIPGCKSTLKEKFLGSVVQILIDEMTQRDRRTYRPEDDVEGMTEGEKAARWYFDVTDVNNDRVLSRSEIKTFKKLLTKQKAKPRKCLRKFTQHCAQSNSKKITLGEFILCLEVNIAKPSRSKKIPLSPISLIEQLKTTDDPEDF